MRAHRHIRPNYYQLTWDLYEHYEDTDELVHIASYWTHGEALDAARLIESFDASWDALPTTEGGI